MALVETNNLKTRSNYAKQIDQSTENVRVKIKKGILKTIVIDGKEFIDITKISSKNYGEYGVGLTSKQIDGLL